jgi:hypothetical protein
LPKFIAWPTWLWYYCWIIIWTQKIIYILLWEQPHGREILYPQNLNIKWNLYINLSFIYVINNSIFLFLFIYFLLLPPVQFGSGSVIASSGSSSLPILVVVDWIMVLPFKSASITAKPINDRWSFYLFKWYETP